VIDSFDAAQATREAARHLIDLAPPAWRFVIAARRPPLERLGPLRAAGDLVEMGALELRFDAGEIATVLDLPSLGRNAPSLIEAVTGGWPGAVAAIIADIGAADEPRVALSELTSRGASPRAGVADEAVRVLSPAAQAVLADAALLRHADASAWAAVAGDEYGAVAYRDALAAQLVVPVDQRWQRAHPPLQSLSEAALANDTERREAVLGRAARWASAAGLAEDAVTYAFAGGDESYGTELIAAYARQSTGRGRPERLLRLVHALAPDLARRPEIVTERGWAAVLAGDLDELAVVVALLDETDEEPVAPSPLAAGVFRTALHLLRGDAHAALRTAQEMTADLDRRAPRMQTGMVDPGWAWSFHAAAAAMAGDFDQAREASRVVVEGGFGGQPLILGAGVGAVLELYGGAPERAAAEARLSMSVADVELEADLPVCAPSLFVLAHDEDPVHAARALTRLRRLRSEAPSPYVDVLVLLAEAVQAARAGRDAEEARRVAEEAQARASRGVDGVPGLSVFIGGFENQIAAAAELPAIDTRLSDAESSVLDLMGRRLTRRQIGEELGISLNTVKFHARSVLRKLGATSTVEAVERARQLGLLPADTAD
jgi:LuxR family maltose regulon positive regulatory protein